jgi:hypothetical protein
MIDIKNAEEFESMRPMRFGIEEGDNGTSTDLMDEAP